jgi:hypothetical protein
MAALPSHYFKPELSSALTAQRPPSRDRIPDFMLKPFCGDAPPVFHTEENHCAEWRLRK